ncbi:MAG: hypothetical protein IK999_18070 [Ruminococcus sp.]|nr:hypothetical protein [Ruminococcus sp.]
MKKCREMTPEIFRNNLLSALAEMDIGSYEPLFRIIRVEKKDVCSDNYGDVFDMIVLSEQNIKDRLLSLDDVVYLLSGLTPYFPTQIKIKKVCEHDGRVELELYTSTRVCRPSQLANIDTGHPPFKVIE